MVVEPMPKCHNCGGLARFIRDARHWCLPCGAVRFDDVPTPTLTQWSGPDQTDGGSA